MWQITIEQQENDGNNIVVSFQTFETFAEAFQNWNNYLLNWNDCKTVEIWEENSWQHGFVFWVEYPTYKIMFDLDYSYE